MHAPAVKAVPFAQRVFLLVGAAIWIGLTGVLDYSTGVEFRIFPLYFLPICLVGWQLGYGLTLFMAWLSAATWLVSNIGAGMQYSSTFVWVVNTATQWVSFSFVGVLVVLSRHAFRLAEARSRTDSLTGLLNSAAFGAEFPRLAAACERHKRPVTVAYIDVDDFKVINDRFGHAEGDRVLATIGATMRSASRDTDLVGRLGGDEFAMALAETDEAGARIVLERLQGALEQALASDHHRVTLSVGAVASMATHPSVEQLLHQADALLYEAKHAGKNRFVVTTIP